MEENIEKNKEVNYFLVFVALSVISVFVSAFYNFYINKNYDFMVETSCDPKKEVCFYRDCGSEDSECSPNNFFYYKKYTISAKDFSICENEDCSLACNIGLINCQETECSMQDIKDEICKLPENKTP